MDVRKQFGDKAGQYGVSAVHARGASLARAVALAAPRITDRVLDVATGAGHMAFAVAPLVREVVCLDLTPAMLEEAARGAASRGFRHLRCVEGDVAEMPFSTGEFDAVFCRLAAHHFPDVRKALREMVRVSRDGGKVVIVDTTVPEDNDLAQRINRIEVFRDPTHVGNYRPSEWAALFKQAGLTLDALETGLTDGEMSFTAWVERSGTPFAAVAQLWQELTAATAPLVKTLQIRQVNDDLWFQLPRVIVVGRKAA